MDTGRGTAAPLSTSGLTWHSGTCPALPYFSIERDKEDALTYVSGQQVNSEVPMSSRSGPLLAVKSGRCFQI